MTDAGVYRKAAEELHNSGGYQRGMCGYLGRYGGRYICQLEELFMPTWKEIDGDFVS